MNGREVFKFAVRIMGDASTRVVDKAGLTSDDIDLFILIKQIFALWNLRERDWV